MVELRVFPLIIARIQVELEFYKPSSQIVLGAVCLKEHISLCTFWSALQSREPHMLDPIQLNR